MKHRLLLAALVAVAGVFARPIVQSASPRLGDVRLDGPVSEKMAALIRERVIGNDARGKIYDEAVNAFRTH